MKPQEIQGLIAAHKSQNQGLIDQWNRWLEYYRGEYWGKLSEQDGDDEVAVDTNYTYAFVDTMAAGVVPAKPAVSLIVRYPALKESRRAREALCNVTFQRNNLARKLRRNAGLTGICGWSFVKGSWESVSKRVVFHPKDPRFLWVDPDAAEWEDVRYIIEAVPLTKAQFDARVKRQGGYNKESAEKAIADAYPDWGRADGDDSRRDAVSKVFKWVVVYEVYDFVEGKYYHVLEDVEKPLMESGLPYKFLRNRFYPVVFNDTLANVFGVSDVGLIDRLQKMLNELDTLMLQFAEACIPVGMFNSSAVDDPQQVGDDLADASGPRDLVDVPLKAGMRMSDVLQYTQTPTLNPHHDQIRNIIMSAIETLLALPGFRRGEVGQAHIATEVAAAMAALQSRNGNRVAVIHDVMAWCARATMALTEEMMGREDVVYAASVQDETVEITRRELRALDPKSHSVWWDDSYFSYKISSYNSPDDSLPVQLRNLSQFLPTLINLPESKRYVLVEKLYEMLGINPDEVMWDTETLDKMSKDVTKALLMQQAQENGGQAPLTDGKQPGPPQDGRMTPSGDQVAQPGVGPGGEVGGVNTTPETLPGMQGGAGIGA